VLSRRPDGSYALRLSADERELLAHLTEQLDDLVGAGPTDPVARRLFPPAYTDDPEREAAYELLAGEELRSSRRAALEVMRTTAASDVLTEDQVTAWLQSVNALRLVLGTRLDVSEDERDEVGPDDPDAAAWALYHYLTFLLDRIVTAMSGRR
jgi:hypothetical protein